MIAQQSHAAARSSRKKRNSKTRGLSDPAQTKEPARTSARSEKATVRRTVATTAFGTASPPVSERHLMASAHSIRAMESVSSMK